jgi:hypothetical protein
MRYLLIIAMAVLSSCHFKSAQDASDEELKRIAADTQMQIAIDKSYEYQKTLPESDQVVYDFTAYDRPGIGSDTTIQHRYQVVRRTGSRLDTVIKGTRLGHVEQAWITDLNHNDLSEITFYETAVGDTMSITSCEMDKLGDTCKSILVKLDRLPHHKAGSDVIHLIDDKLEWQYVTQDKSKQTQLIRQYYQLHGRKLEKVNMDMRELPKL